MKRALVLAAAALLLVGCTPTAPEPTPTASPSASKSATPSPTPTPTLEPLTVPECETLLPIDLARSSFSDNTEFLGERPLTEFTGWFELAEIGAALAASPQGRLCSWGIPNSDGSFSLHVAEVTSADREAMETALTGAGFSSATTGTVTAYEATGENEVSSTAATHLFTGDVWIMSNASSLTTSGIATGSALDALRTANPTLGL